MRTREGMKVAKAKGRLRGKAPKLSSTQEIHLVGLYRAGKHTTAELAELFSVGRSTVYRAGARSKAIAAAGRTAARRVSTARAALPIVVDGEVRATTAGTYRPRHGAPSELPSENRGRSRARTAPGRLASNGTLSVADTAALRGRRGTTCCTASGSAYGFPPVTVDEGVNDWPLRTGG